MKRRIVSRSSVEISEMVTFNNMGQAIQWVKLEDAKELQAEIRAQRKIMRNNAYHLSELEGNIATAEKILKEFPKDATENLALWVKRVKCALCSINKDCSTVNSPNECLTEVDT